MAVIGAGLCLSAISEGGNAGRDGSNHSGNLTLAQRSDGSELSARVAAPVATGVPTITITSPTGGGEYERGSRVYVHYRCGPGAVSERIVACRGSERSGQALDTRSPGVESFTVSATDSTGATVAKTVHYTVWWYVNPLREVTNLQASRVDMGVDYSGSGPVLAIGRARIVLASNRLAGPESCWGRTCVPPPGHWVMYRLLDGPFADEYVYLVENITITVHTGQTVAAGQPIAILHNASPNLEIGWAAGRAAYTLAAARGHQCACSDPGGWSSIEGRNFNAFLTWLGAPSGYFTSIPPRQRMPRGWPALPPNPLRPRAVERSRRPWETLERKGGRHERDRRRVKTGVGS